MAENYHFGTNDTEDRHYGFETRLSLDELGALEDYAGTLSDEFWTNLFSDISESSIDKVQGAQFDQFYFRDDFDEMTSMNPSSMPMLENPIQSSTTSSTPSAPVTISPNQPKANFPAPIDPVNDKPSPIDPSLSLNKSTPTIRTQNAISNPETGCERSNSPTLDPEPTPPLFLTDNERWSAVLTRSTQASGHFFYCVKSTSIYCRPTCPSRRPARSNVEFVITTEEAQEKGYRACKRCKPDEIGGDPIERRQIEVVEKLKRELMKDKGGGGIGKNGEDRVTVTRIAKDMGVSMWHLNRLFKRVVGTSPKAWAQEQLALQNAQGFWS